MRFVFRFEALLTYRAHLKERAEVALGRARQRLRKARQELEGLQTRHHETSGDLSLLLTRRAKSELMRSHVEFLNALQKRIERQGQEVEQSQRRVRERMQDVAARTREYRIIEKLKEKDYETWRHEQNLQEQKILDESATIRHGKAFY